jgi:pantoate--beta-alanine ligase
MKIIKTATDLRKSLHGKGRVGLVPTMGNLHAGHLSLVLKAREHADIVVSSIFVNPLQFAPHEDFLQYPRTLERDCELLREVGCDAVFAPEERDIYVEGQIVRIRPPAIADILEGAARPGFFAGVCTVVLKLFNMVLPKVAVFGKKDYQQLLVIRQMSRQLGLPLEIIAGDIVRDTQGVALSSRNSYLSAAEYAEAPRLSTVLRETARAARGGAPDRLQLERLGRERLAAHGWQPDYIAIRRQSDLGEPSATDPVVVLGAARLGRTRLIDNVEA